MQFGKKKKKKFKAELDKKFKETGHQNAYFRSFVPKSLFEAEEKMLKVLPKNVQLLHITD